MDSPEKLLKAKKEILDYYQREGRNPTSSFSIWIASCLYTRKWTDQGIERWGELMLYCGLKEKEKRNWDYGKTKERRLNKLKKAVSDALNFFEKEGRSPFSSELDHIITNSVFNNDWSDQGIFNWNDFLVHCGLGRTFRKKLTQEEFDEELEQSRKEIIEEKKKGKRLMRGNYQRISFLLQSKVWLTQGITTWKEFLAYCNINSEGNYKLGHLTPSEKELWFRIRKKLNYGYANRTLPKTLEDQSITKKRTHAILMKWAEIPEEILVKVTGLFREIIALEKEERIYPIRELVPILLVLVKQISSLEKVNLSFNRLRELSEKAGYIGELKIITMIKAERRMAQLKAHDKKIKQKGKKSLKEQIGEELHRLKKELSEKGFKEKQVFKKAEEELEKGNYVRTSPRKGAVSLVTISYSLINNIMIKKTSRMMYQMLGEESVEVIARRTYKLQDKMEKNKEKESKIMVERSAIGKAMI